MGTKQKATRLGGFRFSAKSLIWLLFSWLQGQALNLQPLGYEHIFHWQSQNATTPSSKRGQEIIEHVANGIAIHLFVRESKLGGGKAAPFVYHGRVNYQSHIGSSPMSVTFTV
jgi:hypothetical protein